MKIPSLISYTNQYQLPRLPLQEAPDIRKSNRMKPIKKALPFRGLCAWLTSIPSFVKPQNDIDLDNMSNITNPLYDQCKAQGDVVLLTFKGGLHSALLIYDHENQTYNYLSFGGAFTSSNTKQSINQALWSDMQECHNTSLKEKELVKLENMDIRAILNNFCELKKTRQFKIISFNCATLTKKLLLEGSKEWRGNKKLKGDRRFMQMPKNTHDMALELQFLQKNTHQPTLKVQPLSNASSVYYKKGNYSAD